MSNLIISITPRWHMIDELLDEARREFRKKNHSHKAEICGMMITFWPPHKQYSLLCSCCQYYNTSQWHIPVLMTFRFANFFCAFDTAQAM